MNFSIRYWIKISVISLFVVALVGVLMRYKIPFSLPALNQKHLLHAHSHFAFTGWISQTLYVLMIGFMIDQVKENIINKYKLIIIGNIICAYVMLVSFTIEGYGSVSIIFSTLSIFISYLFSYWYYKDLRKIASHPAKSWLNASLLFLVISSLGTFNLAYMMYSKSVDQHQYLGSLYFFLHFQYNGWFLFSAMGLFIAWLHNKSAVFKINPLVFQLFFWACVPAYFLSTLWADLPVWLYVLVVIAAVIQFIAWIILALQLNQNREIIKAYFSPLSRFIFLLVALAFSIKLLLQLGSTIPWVSKLAFGFRPIVIAYLHLILLGVFTLFLLGYSYVNGFINKSRLAIIGMLTIVAGVFLNEFVLLVQGVAGFTYTPVAYVNEVLLIVSVIILTGITLLLIGQFLKGKQLSEA